MDQLTVYGVALVPVMVGLNELLKRTGIPNRFIPATSMGMGYFFSFFYLAQGDLKKGLLYGTILGLSSIGLFSGAKNTFVAMRAVSRKK